MQFWKRSHVSVASKMGRLNRLGTSAAIRSAASQAVSGCVGLVGRVGGGGVWVVTVPFSLQSLSSIGMGLSGSIVYPVLPEIASA